MAKVCAVIAEYNPFHNGHAYHLQKAREKSGADTMLVLMSSYFTQRGEAAVLPPDVRAQMALHCGADIVLTVPTMVSVREADSYAQFNIELLNQMPFVTHLAFGAECGDLGELMEIARILETKDEHLDEVIKKHLESGMCSKAGALANALSSCYGIPKYMTSEPNNILAICYLRALQKTNSKIEPVLIQRKSSYHAQVVETACPSATSMRQAIWRGDWISVKSGMPPAAYEILRKAAPAGQISRPDILDTMLQYRLASITRQEFRSLPDVYEGIENALWKARSSASSREQLISDLATRRYSSARISRLLCHALLSTKAEVWKQHPLHVHLAGINDVSAPVLKYLKRGKLDIVDKRRISEVGDSLRMDRKAREIWMVSTGSFAAAAPVRTIVTT